MFVQIVVFEWITRKLGFDDFRNKKRHLIYNISLFPMIMSFTVVAIWVSVNL